MSTNLLCQNINLVYAALEVPALDGNSLRTLAGLQAGRLVLSPEKSNCLPPMAY